MSKHDFHIALVLIALIAAGTLVYQSLNAVSGSTSNNCTIAIYFSRYDGCNSSNHIEIIPPLFLNERMYGKISPNEIRLFEIDETIEGKSSHPRIGWREKIPATMSLEPDSMLGVKP